MTKPIENKISDINEQIRHLNQEKNLLITQNRVNDLYDDKEFSKETITILESNITDTLISLLDSLGIQTIDSNTIILNQHTYRIRDTIIENIKKGIASFEIK